MVFRSSFPVFALIKIVFIALFFTSCVTYLPTSYYSPDGYGKKKITENEANKYKEKFSNLAKEYDLDDEQTSERDYEDDRVKKKNDTNTEIYVINQYDPFDDYWFYNSPRFRNGWSLSFGNSFWGFSYGNSFTPYYDPFFAWSYNYGYNFYSPYNYYAPNYFYNPYNYYAPNYNYGHPLNRRNYKERVYVGGNRGSTVRGNNRGSTQRFNNSRSVRRYDGGQRNVSGRRAVRSNGEGRGSSGRGSTVRSVAPQRQAPSSSTNRYERLNRTNRESNSNNQKSSSRYGVKNSSRSSSNSSYRSSSSNSRSSSGRGSTARRRDQ